MKSKLFLLPLLVPAAVALAADWPQWGRDPSKNMVSDDKPLPASCVPGVANEKTGEFEMKGQKNIKWAAKLGSYAFGNPTVANGKIFVGTNNESPRDPKFQGDYSCLYCLD